MMLDDQFVLKCFTKVFRIFFLNHIIFKLTKHVNYCNLTERHPNLKMMDERKLVYQVDPRKLKTVN